jgi:DNA-directed RNA polymerase subunit N (RpoN/RPB10)
VVGNFVKIGFDQERENAERFNIYYNFVMLPIEISSNFKRSGDSNVIDDFNVRKYFCRRGMSHDDLLSFKY